MAKHTGELFENEQEELDGDTEEISAMSIFTDLMEEEDSDPDSLLELLATFIDEMGLIDTFSTWLENHLDDSEGTENDEEEEED
jgi:hypothetical protein